MSELKGEGDCPTCGKHYKALERHNCKEKPAKAKTTEKPKKSVKQDDDVQEITSELLVPRDTYLSHGVHIGVKQRTKDMEKYIFKIKNTGLSIFNVEMIDQKIRLIAKYLSNFEPGDILIGCKRDNGHKPLKMIAHATGIKTITGRYLPGTITNPNNENFMEPRVVIITDKWYDKQLLTDAFKSGALVIALCNTNNVANKVDIILPCNNRSPKSLGLIYWLLAREYSKHKGLKFDFKLEQFI